MKKALMICLILIFVAGCITVEEKPKDIVVRASDGLSESLEAVKGDLGSDEYLMTPESRVVIGGREVTMKELAYDYKMTFKIDGQTYLITETNKEEIVNDVIITVKKVNFDPEDVDTYAIVNIIKYVPGENEYLMYYEDNVVVGGSTVTLRRFNDDGSIYVKVDDLEDERVKKGETIEIRDLSITNVKTNLRAITSEKYSVLRIEE